MAPQGFIVGGTAAPRKVDASNARGEINQTIHLQGAECTDGVRRLRQASCTTRPSRRVVITHTRCGRRFSYAAARSFNPRQVCAVGASAELNCRNPCAWDLLYQACLLQLPCPTGGFRARFGIAERVARTGYVEPPIRALFIVLMIFRL
jgi:hypothetical protein